MAEHIDSCGNTKLRVTRVPHGPAVVVHASGDVDMGNVATLHTELVAALEIAVPPAPVVIDLRNVEFLGSAGLNELLVQHDLADKQLTPLRIVATQHRVLRLIEIAGLRPVLTVYQDLDRALHR